MKAVVMAGGEGTRLRPLTSNQPKPMVPIVGKPCMEHILELLRRHEFRDVIVTLAFLPQAIRSYFGDGEPMGLEIEYSVEETPLGTAGSVRLASAKLDDTVLVISGEYSTGMIRSTLTAQPRRGAVLLSKAVVVSLVMAATTVVTYAAAILLTAPLLTTGIDWSDPAQSTVPLLFGVLSMVVFTLLVGLGRPVKLAKQRLNEGADLSAPRG